MAVAGASLTDKHDKSIQSKPVDVSKMFNASCGIINALFGSQHKLGMLVVGKYSIHKTKRTEGTDKVELEVWDEKTRKIIPDKSVQSVLYDEFGPDRSSNQYKPFPVLSKLLKLSVEKKNVVFDKTTVANQITQMDIDQGDAIIVNGINGIKAKEAAAAESPKPAPLSDAPASSAPVKVDPPATRSDPEVFFNSLKAHEKYLQFINGKEKRIDRKEAKKLGISDQLFDLIDGGMVVGGKRDGWISLEEIAKFNAVIDKYTRVFCDGDQGKAIELYESAKNFEMEDLDDVLAASEKMGGEAFLNLNAGMSMADVISNLSKLNEPYKVKMTDYCNSLKISGPVGANILSRILTRYSALVALPSQFDPQLPAFTADISAENIWAFSSRDGQEKLAAKKAAEMKAEERAEEGRTGELSKKTTDDALKLIYEYEANGYPKLDAAGLPKLKDQPDYAGALQVLDGLIGNSTVNDEDKINAKRVKIQILDTRASKNIESAKLPLAGANASAWLNDAKADIGQIQTVITDLKNYYNGKNQPLVDKDNKPKDPKDTNAVQTNLLEIDRMDKFEQMLNAQKKIADELLAKTGAKTDVKTAKADKAHKSSKQAKTAAAEKSGAASPAMTEDAALEIAKDAATKSTVIAVEPRLKEIKSAYLGWDQTKRNAFKVKIPALRFADAVKTILARWENSAPQAAFKADKTKKKA